MQNLRKYLDQNTDILINISAGLLVFFIPISIALTNIMLIPLLVLVVYDSYNKKKLKLFSTLPVFFVSFSIISLSIIAIFKGSFILDIGIYARYFTILLLFALYQRTSKIETIENYYLVGLTVAFVISFLRIVIYKIANPNALFDTGYVIDDMLWGDRPYAAFMLVLAIFICLRRVSLKTKGSWFYLTLVGVFLLFCNFISARLSMGLAILTIVYFIFFRFKVNKKIKFSLSVLFFTAVFVMIIFNKSLILRTPLDKETEFEKIIAVAKDREPRYVIWSCSALLLQTDSNALQGISSYEKYRKDLVDCYGEFIVNRAEKRQYYMDSRFSSHNQFLDFWLNGGIVPFLFLIAAFISVFLSKKNSADTKWIYFLFFCFLLVENVFYRQIGYYLFGIFAVLYTSTNFKKA